MTNQDNSPSYQLHQSTRDFNRGNNGNITDFFSQISWMKILSHNDVGVNIESFYDSLYSTINLNIPQREFTFNGSFPSCFTSDLEQLIFQKKSAHVSWKKSHSPVDYIGFKRLRAICIRESRIAFKKYIKKIESKLKVNPKAFWNFARS